MGNFITRFWRNLRSKVFAIGPAKDWTLWRSLFSGVNGAKKPVTYKTVMGIPAYWRAVELVSTQIASLPFSVYTLSESGAIQEAKSNPLWRVLNYRPSPLYDYFSFMEAIVRLIMAGGENQKAGNALVRVIRDGRGAIQELRIVTQPWRIIETDGKLFYMVGDMPYPASDVLHFKAWSRDGVMGEDPLSLLQNTFGRAISEIDTFASYYGNGAQVSAVLSTDMPLNPDQRKMIEENWNATYGGPENTMKTALLSHGVKYEKIGAVMGDTDIESRRMTVEDISNITGVPIPLLSNLQGSTLNNIEVLNRLFVQYTLRTWCKRFEAEFNSKLFSAESGGKTFVRFNLDGLLRGDTQSRADYYAAMYNIRALNPNEIRQLENMNPYEGGDEYGQPLASNAKESDNGSGDQE